MNRLPISVCMISGAEASRIERALKSVEGWVSEVIIVLNQEVNDGTEELARRYSASVFREPWRGFVEQKNSAQAKAAQPWVLGLDADEAISVELREEIFALFRQKPEQCGAYSLPRCSFYFGRWIRHGDWYPDRCIRLWQRGKGRWVGIDPHAALEVDGPIGKLQRDLLHFPSETINHQIAKTVKYADDFVRHCEAKGRKITLADLV